MTTTLRPLALLRLRLLLPNYTRALTARPLTTTSTASRSITDSTKDAIKTIDRAAGTAALKGIETGEAIAGAARQTVSGATARAEKMGSGVAGKAKGTAAKAGGKAYEVGGKAASMKEEAQSGH